MSGTKANCSKSECPVTETCEKDFVRCTLCKLGVTRSTLISLALVPFAWDGVVWFKDAIQWAWDTVSGLG